MGTHDQKAYFLITSHKVLVRLIDIFTRYSLNTTKLLNFIDFQKAFLLYFNEDRSENILKEIENIRSRMNTKRVDFQMPASYLSRLSPNWLLGFIEAEGSFHVIKSRLRLEFILSQSSQDLALMKLIAEYFNGFLV